MWRQVLALIVKELLAVLRDPKSRMVLIGPPLIQLMVFGYAATYDLNHVPIAIYDQDHSAASRDLVARFTGSPTFQLIATLHSDRQIDALIDARQVQMVLVIDRRFTRDLLTKGAGAGADDRRWPQLQHRAADQRLCEYHPDRFRAGLGRGIMAGRRRRRCWRSARATTRP